MTKSIFKDESGYVQATIALISMFLVAYMIFLAVLPTAEIMMNQFITLLDGNQFYSDSLADRLDTSLDLGWKMPFAFIAIGFVFVIVRTIVRQKYTRYENDEY